MSQEEAIMILKEINNIEICGQIDSCTSFIRTGEQVKDIIIEIINKYKKKESKPKWIPVSERLPKDHEVVIVTSNGYVYPEARYSKEDGWEWAYESGADYWQELEEVKAWMPLPEPYEDSHK